jgi:hypothetical protein
VRLIGTVIHQRRPAVYPMRLVQRHGRLDRIGSHHRFVDIDCFFPAANLDRLLGLEELGLRVCLLRATSHSLSLSVLGPESACMQGKRRVAPLSVESLSTTKPTDPEVPGPPIRSHQTARSAGARPCRFLRESRHPRAGGGDRLRHVLWRLPGIRTSARPQVYAVTATVMGQWCVWQPQDGGAGCSRAGSALGLPVV